MKSLLENLLSQINVEEAAKHSTLNHHAVGFDYLNLHRTNGLTAKIYLSDPDRLETCGNLDYLVNPHNHGYNFHTFVVDGAVDNITFDYVYGGAPYNQYRFSWKDKSFSFYREYDCLYASRKKYFKYDSYYMTHDKIHTIAIPNDEPVCLFLLQYADVKETETSLWSYVAPRFDLRLYKKPTIEETQLLIDRTRKHYANFISNG